MKRCVVDYISCVRAPVVSASFFEQIARVLLLIEKGKRLGIPPKASFVISLVLVSDEKSKALNKAFRKQNKVATVLSFPFVKKGRCFLFSNVVHLGEIVMAPNIIVARARAQGILAKRELTRYFAHAMLHLLGYNHEGRGKKFIKEGKIMERLEEKTLSYFKL